MSRVADRSIVDQFKVSSALCRELETFASAYGVELRPLAEALDLNAEAFADFDNRVSLNSVARLFEVLATVTGDEAFGLKYAGAYTPGGTGSFGYGLKNCPILRDAFEFIAKYYCTIGDLSYLSLEVDHKGAILYWNFSPVIVQRDQFNDFITALAVRHMHEISGDAWQPNEVHLLRAPPKSVREHVDAFGPRVRFDSPVNAIKTDAKSLEISNPKADCRLFELMERQCQSIIAARPRITDVIARTQEEILQQLPNGDISVVRIARRLALSERSFHRRMSENGVTFHELVDGIRKELSDQLLRETDNAMSGIAHQLGFSTAGAYTRAAIRWYGHPPSQERARLHAENEAD